jgi:oxygen-independent coproporphyrinogen-3 oxidase
MTFKTSRFNLRENQSTGLHSLGIEGFNDRMESHPWFGVGHSLNSNAAKDYLARLQETTHAQPNPYCIYVHVPFCASICRFCALYTRAVKGNADAIFDEYVQWLCQSIETHPCAYSNHGPTTVHFGGGTPLHIGLDRFAKVTHSLKKAFGSSDSCEWALETTTSSITPKVADTLAELGFKRIHLGIQTLNDDLRTFNRRHETGNEAIDKIRYLQQQGFLCSADMIIGFDNYSDAILNEDLQRLYASGIRMFSICELRLVRHKDLQSSQHQEQSQRNYQYWKQIWEFMESADLIPIHLGQFADSQESNLYFTHPARGENCVAIGPYAHGSAGRLYYSNKLLPAYYEAIKMGESPIETAVLYDDQEEIILNLEREMLAHRVTHKTIETVLFAYPERFADILDFWQNHELMLPAENGLSWSITREGSWYIGNMITQIRDMAVQPVLTHERAVRMYKQ